ncbi:MAG: hypothetical protein V8T53_09450 [Eubacteriales bacterium]
MLEIFSLSPAGTLFIDIVGAMFAWLESVKFLSIGRKSGPMKTSRNIEMRTTSATTASLRLKNAFTASFEGLSSFSTAKTSSSVSSLLAPKKARLSQRHSVPPAEEVFLPFFFI